MSCLLVEDNKFMQGVLGIVMYSLGVQNYYFDSDGKEAVEIIQLRLGALKAAGVGGINGIVSDVVMPGIDGNMLLR
tara:strand:+ start:911 stop:1138 length:228 start_codon:yes stop_codon:yes gene_type:complete